MKKGIKITSGVLFAIFLVWYISAFDWSRSHSKEVEALPYFHSTVADGSYRIQANGLEYLARVAGMNNNGPGVILLHGFPESSLMWSPLMDQANELGYKIMAFDQRGYSPGARPQGLDYYHVDSLVSDVLAIADVMGFDTFHLVGHDWGSGVGWKVAMDYPERIKSWTAMSIPHIGVFFESVLDLPAQQEKSSYMLQLRKPVIPELFFRLFQGRITKALEESWTPEQVTEFRSVFREKGALKGALNWYRALDYQDREYLESIKKKVEVPILYIWGEDDLVLAHEVVPLQKPYVVDSIFQELRLKCGHSIIQEAEDEVIAAIIEHWAEN